MKKDQNNGQESQIADAINNLASEVRILTFGKTSLSEVSPGAIESLNMAVSDSGKEIASSISAVANSLADIAEAINSLAESLNRPKGK